MHGVYPLQQRSDDPSPQVLCPSNVACTCGAAPSAAPAAAAGRTDVRRCRAALTAGACLLRGAVHGNWNATGRARGWCRQRSTGSAAAIAADESCADRCCRADVAIARVAACKRENKVLSARWQCKGGFGCGSCARWTLWAVCLKRLAPATTNRSQQGRRLAGAGKTQHSAALSLPLCPAVYPRSDAIRGYGPNILISCHHELLTKTACAWLVPPVCSHLP